MFHSCEYYDQCFWGVAPETWFITVLTICLLGAGVVAFRAFREYDREQTAITKKREAFDWRGKAPVLVVDNKDLVEPMHKKVGGGRR